MSWTPVPAARCAQTRALVTMRADKGDGKQKRRVCITIRDREILALPWFTRDRKVDLLVGAGEHAGRLRVIPGTSVKPFATGRAGRQVLTIGSSALCSALALRPGAFGNDDVGYDFGDDWIEIDLPAWARPASSQGAPALRDMQGAPAAQPYRGELARTPAPISRAAGGPIR